MLWFQKSNYPAEWLDDQSLEIIEKLKKKYEDLEKEKSKPKPRKKKRR